MIKQTYSASTSKSPLLFLFSLIAVTLFGCTPVETFNTVASNKVETYHRAYSGPKTLLAIGNFENRSNYLRGIFSSNTDRLGNQATTILKTHLQQSKHFRVLDRENLSQIEKEAALIKQSQKVVGARYVVTGAVSEFGRKEVGDKQFFGILGSGKTQIAYSKVSLNIIDVLTSEIIYSTQGAGEYKLSQREILGFGSDASYDATLNGKVLNLSIVEAINTMTRDIENGSLQLVAQ